jgi:hypothetical protein
MRRRNRLEILTEEWKCVFLSSAYAFLPMLKVVIHEAIAKVYCVNMLTTC